MKYDIKYIILFIIIGAVCSVSCTSDPEPTLLDSEKGEEMRFEVGDASRSTTITTTGNLTSLPFRLFADAYKNNEYVKPGFKVLFNNKEVTYKNNRWDYGTKEYWEMGQDHSFVAIHPFEIPGLNSLKYSESEVSFTYEMPSGDADQRDILVATHRRKYTFDDSDAVKFNFQHLLSRINVAPALKEDLMYDADDESKKDFEFDYELIKNEFIQVRKIEFIGFYTKAQVSIKPQALSGNEKRTDKRDINIVEDTSSDNYTITINIKEEDSPHILNNGVNISLIKDKDAVLMIPQTFGDNAQLKLGYTVNTDNTDLESLRYVIVPLKGNTLERNKSYTLKFTIEKVYKGQIQDGSIEWIVKDVFDKGANEKWVSEDDTIEQGFIVKNPDDSETENSESSENDEE